MGPGTLRVDRLGWHPHGSTKPVLTDLSLSVAAGQRVLVLGPSGAGKSTLLRAVAGVLNGSGLGEQSGRVTIDGVDPAQRPGAAALVLQEPGAGIVAGAVAEDVAFGLENVAAPADELDIRITRALSQVGLGDLPASTSTAALSGGQTQRVALAGAIAMEPSVLVLDEPTAMLDAQASAQVRAAVAEITADRALTLLVADHDAALWLPIIDRVVVLNHDGALVADGDPQLVFDDTASLLALGIWAPGAPPPDPLRLPTIPVKAATDTSQPPVWARGISVSRPAPGADDSGREVVAVRDISVTVDAEQLTVITGPSGSGKSTLLATLAGWLHPTRGQVTPQPRSSTELAASLAWLPQWVSGSLVADTVRNEVLATSRALHIPDSQSWPMAQPLLARLGLADRENADPATLSGGEQRRLALLAALLHGPRAMLADEPTIAQDRQSWAAVMGLMQAYRRGGGALAVASHDELLIATADTVIDLPPPPLPAPAGRGPALARVGPSALMLACLLAVLAAVLSPNWRWSLVVLTVEVGVIAGALSGAHRRRRAMRALLPGLVAALLVGWSTWLLGGRSLELAANGVTRILVMVLPGAVLLRFVDTDRFAAEARAWLRLPSRVVVSVAAALLRTQRYAQLWRDQVNVRRARGLSARGLVARLRSLPRLTVTLLAGSISDAATLAIAMDARGFAHARVRSWYRPARWGWPETITVSIALGVVALALLGRALLS